MHLDAANTGQLDSRERFWLAAVVIAAIVTYIPTMIHLVGQWINDTQYSLAFLVPPISGYFIWKKWPEVKHIKRNPNAWGLGLIAFALFLHLIGTVLDISGPSGFSMLIAVVGMCIYFHGPALVRALAFPLAYMIFLVPIPGGVLDLVGFPLQLWASGMTAVILNSAGMEVTRNGVNLAVPGYNFQVAQACSGLSSLVALVGVTAVYAYLTKLPPAYKWVLFLLALPVALAANIVRITTIALVGYQWGPDIATNVYHDWSSPILFMAAICFLFVINWGLEWISARRNISSSS